MSLTLTRRHNVDRFGYLIPTKYGNVPMVGAVATYRPGEGRFGGAVAVEEGTTNHIPRSRLKFEGWTAYQGAEVTVTQGYSIPGVTEGGATRIQTSGGDSIVKYYYDVGSDEGNPAAYSVWVYNIGQKTVRVWGNTISVAVDVAPGEVKRCTGAVERLGSSLRQIQFRALDPSDSLDFIAFQPQIETKPFATSFVDGTRAAGVLRYPQLLDKKRGTLSVWINPHVLVNWNSFFSMNLSTGRFLLYFHEDGSSTWDFGPNGSGPGAPAGTIVAGQWTMHTLTWDADAGVYRYYVNGEFVGERQYVEPDSLPSTLPTVINYGALLNELLILPYAASEEEIVSWYEAQGPLPPHPQASLQWDRQTVRPAQMTIL